MSDAMTTPDAPEPMTDEELAWIRDRVTWDASLSSPRKAILKWLATIDSLKLKLAEAERERDNMREALKPFATAGALMDLVRRDDADVVYTPVIDANYCITAGDLRRARAALTQEGATALVKSEGEV